MTKLNGSQYARLGYESRDEYLLDLADEMGLKSDIVFTLADVLGENEDFDGLISSLQDYAGEYGDDDDDDDEYDDE